MQLTTDHQALINFFANRPMPTGPQHINDFSVFLNLPGAIATGLEQLHSEVDASSQSAAILLEEVKDWLVKQEIADL